MFETAIAEEQGLDGRIIDATLRLVARYGLAKLTIDDVAREAGCSRATLYRYHPGRQALLSAVLASEADRLRAGLDDALDEVTTLEEALAAAAAFGADEFSQHVALQFLLAYEPGAVLPHLCFAGADRLLGEISAAVAPHLARFLPTLQARRVGEWVARVVLSYGCTPPSHLPGDGGAAAAVRAVCDFVVPAVAGGSNA